MILNLPYANRFGRRVGKALALISLLLIGRASTAQAPTNDVVGALKFVKQQLASESFESVAVFDVNNDQMPDIVSGGFWYEGPNFTPRHAIGSAQRYGEYWDDFSTVPMDVNGDGRMDFISGSWFGKRLVWMENPGTDQEWPEHLIA
ncbi:MAG: VCBS repeat-containing protein [Tunicatimonas sp.]